MKEVLFLPGIRDHLSVTRTPDLIFVSFRKAMKVTPVSLLIVFFLCSVIDAFPQKRKSAIIK